MDNEERKAYASEELIKFESPEEIYVLARSFLTKKYLVPMLQPDESDVLAPMRVKLLKPKSNIDKLTVQNYMEGLRRLAQDQEYQGILRSEWGLEDFLGSIYIFNPSLRPMSQEGNLILSIETGLNKNRFPNANQDITFLNIYSIKNGKGFVYTSESDLVQSPIKMIMGDHLGPSRLCEDHLRPSRSCEIENPEDLTSRLALN